MQGQLLLLISALLCLCPFHVLTLQVEITSSSDDAFAGEMYILTCTVTVPTLGTNATVEWAGAGSGGGLDMDVREGALITMGNVTTLSLIFDPLQDSQDGDYTCMATFMTNTSMNTVELTVIAPEVTVTAIAMGDPIVGGTDYSLTCDHDAPLSLNATVQSTLTTPDGTMITSLPYTFNQLLASDNGQYNCTATVSSPYLIDSFAATPGTPLDVAVEFPGAPLTPNITETIVEITRATIQWTVPYIASTPETYVVHYGTSMGTLDMMSDSVESGNETDLIFSVEISGLEQNTTYYYRVVSTNSYNSTETVIKGFTTGILLPAAPLTPNITETIVEITRVTIQWTVPYIASTPETYVVHYGTSMGTLDMMSDSVESGNETDLIFSVEISGLEQNTTYYYRVVSTNSYNSTETVIKGFTTGTLFPGAPLTPNITETIVEITRATIQWTVPYIAFTPETYVVHYGTSMGTLDMMSDSVESGNETDLIFSVEISGLEQNTTYYYRVVSTNSYNSTETVIKGFTTGILSMTPTVSMLMPMEMTESVAISTQVIITSVPTPSMSCDNMEQLLPDCDVVSSSLHRITPTPMEFASGLGSGSGMDSIVPDFSSIANQLPATATPSPTSSPFSSPSPTSSPFSSPSPTSSPSPSPSPTPFDYILISFNVSVADYRTIEENFTALVEKILMEAGLTAELVIAVDNEQSNATTTLVMVYLESELGVANNTATMEAYEILITSTDPQWVEFQEENNIEITIQVNVGIPPTTTPSQFDLPLWQWVVIGVSGGILISAWLVLCCCCCCRCSVLRKKRREEKERSRLNDWNVRDYWERGEIEMNTTTSTERQVMVRKVSRISFRSRAQVKSYPLTVDELEQLLANIATLHAQYSSISSNMITMTEVPPGAEDKNRYKDVLPNPHSRVALFLKFGVPNSDYINANYISGYTGVGKTYIATQGPLYWTIADFWRMVWEQKSSVIIMTTGLEERGLVKCARYWPDERVAPSSVYEELEVTIRRRMTSRDYAVTYFRLRHIEKMVSREVIHFWFTAWPDHGVPRSTQSVMDFLLQTKKYIRDTPGPVVVHCSAGIGRTGVFIGADIGMQQLEETGEVDILKIVSTMRLDRGGMVQTRDQFIFLHQVLLDYARYLEQLRSSTPHRTAPHSSHRLETTLEEEEYDSDDSQKFLVQN